MKILGGDTRGHGESWQILNIHASGMGRYRKGPIQNGFSLDLLRSHLCGQPPKMGSGDSPLNSPVSDAMGFCVAFRNQPG